MNRDDAARGSAKVCSRLLLPLLSLAVILGCAREEPWEPEIVAAVGERALTAGEVTAWEASLPPDEATQEARSTFIRRWVEEELLYQAAIEKGLLGDPWVVQRLDELTRTLAVSRMLEVENAGIPQPTPGEVQAYFQEHASEFVWPHLHMIVDYWWSDDRSGMNALRSNLLRGRQTGLWMGRSSGLESGRIALDGPGSAAPEIWRGLSGMKVGEVSQVLTIQEACWVFKIVDRREAGESQGLDDVRDEIVARLLEEARRERREELIRTLADRYRHARKLQWSPPETATVAAEGADTAAGRTQ